MYWCGFWSGKEGWGVICDKNGVIIVVKKFAKYLEIREISCKFAKFFRLCKHSYGPKELSFREIGGV